MIEPFEPLLKEDRDAVAEEGERLVHFMVPPEDAQASEVQFAETS